MVVFSGFRFMGGSYLQVGGFRGRIGYLQVGWFRGRIGYLQVGGFRGRVGI